MLIGKKSRREAGILNLGADRRGFALEVLALAAAHIVSFANVAKIGRQSFKLPSPLGRLWNDDF